MTNPFPAQFPQPVQHPNADPAYAAFLASMQAAQHDYASTPYAPQFPVQQAPQYAPPTPPVQLAQGSLDDFYGQPSVGGGAAWKFAQLGAANVGIVSREVTRGDVEQATDVHGNPQTFRDGRPKFQLKVPMAHPDGTEGTWYVKGGDRDELSRAMTEAGAPTGPPEKGAAIRVTYVKDKPNGPGMSATKIKTVEYMRPTGSATPAPVQTVPVQANPTPAPGLDFAALNARNATTPAPTQAPAAPVQQAAPAPAAVTLDADQTALLAQLTGG